MAIAELRGGLPAQVEGSVSDARIEPGPHRQLLVRLNDGSGELVLRFLHFYPSLQKALLPGARVRARGEARSGYFGLEMVHPVFRAVDEHTPLASALTPVYPSSAQLPQAYLRKAVDSALGRADLRELLPSGSVPPGLPTLREALQWLHHPPPSASQAALQDRSHPAWQRLKYDELLAQQLSQRFAQRDRAKLPAPHLAATASGLHQRLLATLPFALTQAQRRVAGEIAADLGRTQPMHRLLQGDVGSGKTVLAALAAAVAIDSGWQCALMAPTEILAEQHFRKLVQWLEPLVAQTHGGVAWLTGSRKGKARRVMVERVASGDAMLVVGTHAVLQDDVHFARLGLAIVDEQHRFGVAQRLALRRKLNGLALEPHLLMMSATPIPRTLAMSYFADLDVSTLDQLPPGRRPVLTKLFADGRRAAVIARVADAVAQGRQVYWVCPLIEDSDHANGVASQADADGVAAQAHAGAANVKARSPGRSQRLDLQNATETHAQLSAVLPDKIVGLLHGRMPMAEKAAVMAQFSSGEMALLVATTVIEVGVDVPNASVMVIEHAERFGLSQLHQLRGRVGRGSQASVCVLLYSSPLSSTGRDRLRAMSETSDGFEIARRDLEIRGPGEFMGARQSGEALLRFADLADDAPLLRQARLASERLIESDPEAAQAHIERWLENRIDFMKA